MLSTTFARSKWFSKYSMKNFCIILNENNFLLPFGKPCTRRLFYRLKLSFTVSAYILAKVDPAKQEAFVQLLNGEIDRIPFIDESMNRNYQGPLVPRSDSNTFFFNPFSDERRSPVHSSRKTFIRRCLIHNQLIDLLLLFGTSKTQASRSLSNSRSLDAILTLGIDVVVNVRKRTSY